MCFRHWAARYSTPWRFDNRRETNNRVTNSTSERGKTIYPALALGLTTAAFIIAKTGRDALFFQGKGVFQLPVAAMTIAAASLPLAILFVKMMRSFGARPARVGLMLFAAAVLAIAAPFLHPGDSALLFNIYIFIPGVFGVIFASLWLLASDIFETTPKPESARARRRTIGRSAELSRASSSESISASA